MFVLSVTNAICPFLTATAAARGARDEHHQINVRCIGANWKSAVLEKRRAFSPNYERLKKRREKIVEIHVKKGLKTL